MNGNGVQDAGSVSDAPGLGAWEWRVGLGGQRGSINHRAVELVTGVVGEFNRDAGRAPARTAWSCGLCELMSAPQLGCEMARLLLACRALKHGAAASR